jgi:hypothetical protein
MGNRYMLQQNVSQTITFPALILKLTFAIYRNRKRKKWPTNDNISCEGSIFISFGGGVGVLQTIPQNHLKMLLSFFLYNPGYCVQVSDAGFLYPYSCWNFVEGCPSENYNTSDLYKCMYIKYVDLRHWHLPRTCTCILAFSILQSDKKVSQTVMIGIYDSFCFK